MLKTVRDACVLQSNALEIRISDQIEQLDELIHTEGDGSGYFAKTHITQGMDQLVREGLARLAGKSNQAVFQGSLFSRAALPRRAPAGGRERGRCRTGCQVTAAIARIRR